MHRVFAVALGVLLSTIACSDGGDPAADTASGSGASSGTGAGATSGGGGPDGGSGGSGAGGAAGGAGGGASGDIGPTAVECALPPPPSGEPCEATGDGRCYYVDAAAGDDDAGDGSHAAPWRTLANVVTYYGTPGELGSTPAPAGAVDLQPGDVVYLREGTYSDVYNYAGILQIVRFRSVTGISLRAYPGEAPILDAGGQAYGIVVLQSDDVHLSGLEIRGGLQSSLRLEEAQNVNVDHVYIHDTDGVDNDNIAGLYLVGSADVDIGCSELHDNYDHENADTGGEATHNSGNVVAFGGGSVRIHHSKLWQSPEPTAAKTGGCIKYKHAASLLGSTFEVDHNELSRCRFFAVGTGTAHSNVHHNVIREGEGLVSQDYGGPTHQTDQRFEYNTVYLAGGFSMSPTTDWANADYDDPQAVVFAHNIVVHSLAETTQESATVVIGTYGSDELHDATVGELTFAANCYFNDSGAASFALFAANGGNYGSEGAIHSLAEWQVLGYDLDSIESDPQLVDGGGADLVPAASSPCAAMGAHARWGRAGSGVRRRAGTSRRTCYPRRRGRSRGARVRGRLHHPPRSVRAGRRGLDLHGAGGRRSGHRRAPDARRQRAGARARRPEPGLRAAPHRPAGLATPRRARGRGPPCARHRPRLHERHLHRWRGGAERLAARW